MGIGARTVKTRVETGVERYDWLKDPNNYRIEGHMPPNRCFRCGFRFLGAKWASFCNICYAKMTPDIDDKVYVVTQKPSKDTKPPTQGEGYWTTRRELIANLIRIPDDIPDEFEYRKKLDELEKNETQKEADGLYKVEFKTGYDIAAGK